MGAPPFGAGDVGGLGFRASCAAGLGDVLFTAGRPGLGVRSCRAVLEDLPPAGGATVAGGAFLPGRDAESAGRCVLRDGFPAGPVWEVPGVGAAGVFGTAPEFSRRVARALPCLPPDFGTFGPPGWGGRGSVVVCGADVPELPRPMVTLVCSEVWVLLFTVLPPVR